MVKKDRKGKREGRDGDGEGEGRVGSPKLMLGPQKYFSGDGAVESVYWTSY